MINGLFFTEFYVIFRAPNADELISTIENVCDTHEVDNDYFSWGKHCIVDRIPLRWENFNDLLIPSMKVFAHKLEKDFDYTMFDPWLNLYKKGYFQEIHDHAGNDISCVFFANQGDNFGRFFFTDRNSCNFTPEYEDLINYSNSHEPTIKKGDIMFFSSHIFHGVSPHHNDEVRKTLSFNINLKEVFS